MVTETMVVHIEDREQKYVFLPLQQWKQLQHK